MEFLSSGAPWPNAPDDPHTHPGIGYTPPLGALYAASYARSQGYSVAFFDAMLAESERRLAALQGAAAIQSDGDIDVLANAIETKRQLEQALQALDDANRRAQGLQSKLDQESQRADRAESRASSAETRAGSAEARASSAEAQSRTDKRALMACKEASGSGGGVEGEVTYKLFWPGAEGGSRVWLYDPVHEDTGRGRRWRVRYTCTNDTPEPYLYPGGGSGGGGGGAG